MNFWKSFTGMLKLEITSAEPEKTLGLINKAGIPIFDVKAVSALTVQCVIHRTHYNNLSFVLESRGNSINIIGHIGAYWKLLTLRKRPVLLFSTFFLLILTVFLPSRILFVEVEGNAQITDQSIIDKAEKCGISFMASRREVRSEHIKNMLLEEIPQLQWVGVNTVGCIAVISVRERETVQTSEEMSPVSSIVAARDGVICDMTVLRGNPLCKVGQAVKAGQTLVSGYTDCGLCITATNASAEIIAQTYHQLDSVALVNERKRGKKISESINYTILLGKKQIKLFKGSGISDTRCVKMYEKKYLTLPGGFKLPVAIIKEQYICYDEQFKTATQEDFKWMNDVCTNYLKTQMVAGQILHKEQTISLNDKVCSMQGKYECLEMIGRTQKEELMQKYGEDS